MPRPKTDQWSYDTRNTILESARIVTKGDVSPLKWAVCQENAEMVELLLSRGAQLDESDFRCSLQIHVHNKPEILALLNRYQGTDWRLDLTNDDVEFWTSILPNLTFSPEFNASRERVKAGRRRRWSGSAAVKNK